MKMRRKWRNRWTLLFVGALALAAGIAFLLAVDLKSEWSVHQTIVADLSSARHDHRLLDEQILRSRAFLIDHYDEIVETNGRLSDFCASKSEVAETASWRRTYGKPAVVAHHRSFCEAIERKQEAIERFKSANSIVKNGLRYLPELIARVSDARARLASEEALSRVLRFSAEPENEEIRRELLRLGRASPGANPLPREVARQVRTTAEALHARAAAEQVVFDPAAENAIASLQQAYFNEYNARARWASWIRNALILVCAVLVVAVIAAFVKIHRDGALVEELNKTLESKVKVRTEELEEALKRLRESQQLMNQNTKMSALGEMAGGIAHEINTPLGTILVCAQNVGKHAAKVADPGLAKNAEIIVLTVRRISRIVHGLRKFCRDSSRDELSLRSLREIVEETLVFCQEKFRSHGIDIRVSGELDHTVNCIPEQIGQILLNLLNNSYDAIGSSEGPLWVEIHGGRAPDGVTLTVRDSGPGIPADIAEKLMQPFFTTKPIGKGTGLGLSISKGIAESHGGSLAYIRDSSHTTFRLTLPDATYLIPAA